MKFVKLLLLLLIASLCLFSSSNAQGYIDPAQSSMESFVQRFGETYTLVGTFKVKGRPYLYGEKIDGDMFSSKEKAYNISLSYNTYNQELAFISADNANQPLVKTPGEIDSFVLRAGRNNGIENDLKFIYEPLV